MNLNIYLFITSPNETRKMMTYKRTISPFLMWLACATLIQTSLAHAQNNGIGYIKENSTPISSDLANPKVNTPLGLPLPNSLGKVNRPLSANTGDQADYLIPPPRDFPPYSSRETLRSLTNKTIVVDVAVEVDYELYLKFGSTALTETYVKSLFASVSNIYQASSNLRINPSFIRIWSNPNDPWITNAGTLEALQELRQYWMTNEATRPRGTVMLLSGKSLGGGIAYLGSVCQKSGAYDTAVAADLEGVVSTAPGASTWDVVVVAHELGHNLGALHTHCTQRSSGGGYYDRCYGQDEPVGQCYSGPNIATQGTIMSYCHAVSFAGMSAINPVSFIDNTGDPAISNRIRSTAQNFTTSSIGGCLKVDSTSNSANDLAPVLYNFLGN